MNEETAIQTIEQQQQLKNTNNNNSTNNNNNNNNNGTFKFMLVGALAGLFSDAIVHPIDTIRTNTIIRSSSSSSSIPKFNYSLRSLYRGFSVVSIFTIPAHASYFVSYEKSKEYLLPILKNDNLTYLASGLIADIFGGLFWCPMDVMKQRFQYHQKLTFKDMFTNHSINLIYKGFATSIVVYGPYVSLYFMLYENFKKLHIQRFNNTTSNGNMTTTSNMSNMSNNMTSNMTSNGNNNNTSLSLPYYMMYASCASTISAIVTTPLDVIKTKVQTLDIYKSPLDVLRKENPFTHFSIYMSGWKPRALWMASGTALTMVFYEQFKHLLNNNNNMSNME